jgi:hypothetical protein
VQIDDDLIEFLSLGVATIVASRDEQLRPEIGRGWGIRMSAERDHATVCLPAPDGSRMRANLEQNGAIAVTCSLPTSYRTIQLKGETVDLRAPSSEQLDAVDAHADAFAREAEQFGLPARLARKLLEPELTAVTFSVRELYDQTPGPNAGTPL